MIKEQIIKDLKKVLVKLGFPQVEPVLEHPAQAHGDYATNVAMVLFGAKTGLMKRGDADRSIYSPMDLAEKIAQEIKKKKPDYLQKIEVAPPGFINFWLSKDYLISQLEEILKAKEKYGAVEVGKGKKVQVEFISANPTGPLHMGNIRGGPIGDVLANVLAKAGFNVEREFYLNNIGGQVDTFGKTLLAIAPPKKRPIIGEPLQYRGEFWNQLAQQVREEVDKQILNWSIPPSYDDLVRLYKDIGIELVLREMKKDITDLGIKFDSWARESEIANKKTKMVIDELKTKGVVKEKEGALWFAPHEEFLKDRECVLLKSDGSSTYFANDIVYHWDKFVERKLDLVIDVWGANHHGHVPRMKAAVKALGIDPQRLQVILYQWVSLKKEGKRIPMSKRKGEFITAREVLEEIGKDALRFLLLVSGPDNHLELDLDLAKKRVAENPVFYVQYAHARICSIFKKSPKLKLGEVDLNLLTHPAEIELSKYLLRLPEVVEEIARTYSVHQLTTYAQKLADLFHKFYEECRVISEDKKLTQARLSLVLATQIVLKNTLALLGISAPERM